MNKGRAVPFFARHSWGHAHRRRLAAAGRAMLWLGAALVISAAWVSSGRAQTRESTLTVYSRDTAPGTPGAVPEEVRDARRRPLARAADRPLTGLRAPATPPRRFSLRKRPNTAVPPAELREAGRRRNRLSASEPTGLPPAAGARPVTLAPPADPVPATIPIAPPVSDLVEVQPGLPPEAAPRPRRRTAEPDPYAPLGLRMGAFTVLPSLTVETGYDTNPARAAQGRKGSAVVRVAPALSAVSDFEKHQVRLDLRGSYTGYTDLSDSNQPQAEARLGVRLDVLRDTTIDIDLRSRLDAERTGSVNLPGGVKNPPLTYRNDLALGVTQRFGRLSVGLRGTVERSDFENAKLVGGGTSDQQDRALTAYGVRLRGGYELTPGFTPFLEAGLDTRVHDRAVDRSGFRRDSDGSLIRAGTTFELTRTLVGEVALGYAHRRYDDPRLKDLTGPVLDGALSWSMSPLTTLTLRAATELAETTLVGTSGSLGYRGGLELSHALLRNLTLTGTLGLSKTQFDGISREETGVTAGLAGDYRFNRWLSARASYAYEKQQVNTPGEDYSVHTVLFGFRIAP